MEALTIQELSMNVLAAYKENRVLKSRDIYGWQLRDFKATRDVRVACRKAYKCCDYTEHVEPKYDDVVGFLAAYLLDVFKRDRKIKSTKSESELKSTTYKGQTYFKIKTVRLR